MNGNWIRMNVGGKIFQTTKQTLQLREPHSFLARLCQEDAGLPIVKDTTGAILIDRDPQYFDMILHYLRTGFLKAVKNAPVGELVEEAEFYNLPLLSDLIKRQGAQEIIVVTRHFAAAQVDVVTSVTRSDYVVIGDLKKKGLALKGRDGAYWIDAKDARGREFTFEDCVDEDMQDTIREPNGWEVIYAWAWSTLLGHGFKIVSEEKTTAWTKWEFVRDAAA